MNQTHNEKELRLAVLLLLLGLAIGFAPELTWPVLIAAAAEKALREILAILG